MLKLTCYETLPSFDVLLKSNLHVQQTRGLYYKTFYDSNLRIFVISWEFVPGEPF